MGLFSDLLDAVASTDKKTGRKTSMGSKINMANTLSPKTQRGTPRKNSGTNRLLKMEKKK